MLAKSIKLPKIALLAVLALACGFVFNADNVKADPLPVMHVSGTLSSNQVWEEGYVYYVDSAVTVPNNITLTIEAGAIVKVKSFNVGVIVDSGGELDVNGTGGSPVMFTSYKDDSAGGDSNNDGPSSGVSEFAVAIDAARGTTTLKHVELKNVTRALSSNCSSGPDEVTLTDSIISSPVELIDCNPSLVTLHRNHFTVPGDYPVMLNGGDVTTVILAGANKNTFSGSGKSTAVHLMNKPEVPASTSWVLDGGGGLEALLGDTLDVSGTLDIEAGMVVKGNMNKDAINVKAGGALNVNGSSSNPVVFTSYRDDSVAGDSDGSGPSSGTEGDYYYSLRSGGGEITAEYMISRYGSVAIYASNSTLDLKNIIVSESNGFSLYDSQAVGDAIELHGAGGDFSVGIDVVGGNTTLTNTEITNWSDGLVVGVSGSSSDALVTFRGSFSDIGDRAIAACDWGQASPATCAVDAAYTDWGSADGPFVTGGQDLVCGTVSVSPWVYNLSTYNEEFFSTVNCSGNPTPIQTLSSKITAFQEVKSQFDLDCQNGIQDACAIRDLAMACLAGAVNVAASTSPIPLPEIEEDWQIASFGDTLHETISDEVIAAGVQVEMSDAPTSMHILIGHVLGTLTELDDAYSSCTL